ncbi:MAG: hypothetical protein Q4G35_14390, partial [Propionibacteriaceae bacterium]|nr:hypothetical protein [Propionibacteriaceae bacterium]
PDAVTSTRAIVLLPATTLDDAIAPIEVLIQEGLTVVSLPAAGELTPQQLSATFGPRLTVGVHDLGEQAQARWAVEQHVPFALTDGRPEVADVLAEAGVAAIASALTPTEVAAVWRSGVAGVQVVPATAFGNSYPPQLVALVPQAALIARGAESSYEIKAWLNAGAAAVAVGEKLLGDALNGGDLAALRLRARPVAEAAAATTA